MFFVQSQEGAFLSASGNTTATNTTAAPQDVTLFSVPVTTDDTITQGADSGLTDDGVTVIYYDNDDDDDDDDDDTRDDNDHDDRDEDGHSDEDDHGED